METEMSQFFTRNVRHRCFQFFLSIFLSIYFSCVSGSQPAYPRFDRYSIKDGLAGNTIRSIHQDRKGFLWFACGWGIDRFDGYSFKYYPGCGAMNFAEDAAGRLWVAGNIQGLFCYDPQSDSLYHTRYKLAEPNVRKVFIDRDNTLWVVTRTTLHRIDLATDSVTIYPRSVLAAGEIRCIREDKSGNFWLGYADSLLYFEKKTGCSRKYLISGISAFNDIAIDKYGSVWTGNSLPAGFGLVDTAKHVIHPVYENGSAVSANALAIDDDGKIWVGSSSGGLKVYDPHTQQWTTYTCRTSNPSSLIGDDVTALYRDRTGNLWIGTTDGISKLPRRQKKFTYIAHNTDNPNSPPKNTIQSLCEDRQGNVWLGSLGDGVVEWNRKTGAFTRHSQFPSRTHLIKPDHSGKLWIAGRKDKDVLYEYDPATRVTVKHVHSPGDPRSLPPGMVTDLCEDPAGILWLGFSQNLLCRWDRKNGTIRTFPLDTFQRFGDNEPHIKAMLYDSHGILWIAAGRFLVSMDTRSYAVHRYLPDPKDSTTIGNVLIYSIHEDAAGRIWFGMIDRMQRYMRETKIFRNVRPPGPGVSGILEDAHGRLWLRGNDKLMRYDPEMDRLGGYGEFDGFPPPVGIALHIGVHPCVKLKSDEMVFSVSKGVVIFHPDSIHENNDVPPVVLTDFRILDKPVKVGKDSPLKKGLAEAQSILLSYDQNSFSMEFAALDYTVPSKNQYCYRLEGIDRDWILCGNRRFVQYTHVPPGDYRFTVIGSNNDGVWNKQGASIFISVLPPWWMTWWFRIAAAITAIALIVLIVQYRMRQKLALERVRLQIASDLHDDIGSSLSSIALVTENVRCTLEENHPAHSHLKSVTDVARQTADRLKDDVWVIKPGSDTLENLVLRMKDSTQTVIGHIEYTLHVNTNGTSLQVPPEFRRNILFIYKEVLHNIVKHSHADSVRISFVLEGGLFILDVRDNGTGFDIQDAPKGNGLLNLKRRAEAVKGDLTIETGANMGTHVLLKTKIP